MTALHLAVLLRPSRTDVAMANPQCLHRQGEGKGELLPVIALQLADAEGKRPADLRQEHEARALVQPAIQPQDAKARAIIQRGVLERPAARDLNELHVDLDAFASVSLFKELHLPGDSLAGPPQAWQADVAKDPLDCAHRDADVVSPPEPELGARSAVGEISTRLANELDNARRYPSAAPPRIPGDKPLHRALTPPHPPAPDRPDTDSEAAACRRRSLKPCEVNYHQPLPALHRYCSRTFTSLSLITRPSPGTARLPI